ncbi:MAG: hypothetical protein FD127_3484 [Acidimicrobiaceae bacterium]|nr:MAG: hypothetical protein FD127_3484 [Acidimicrobiaceae bacterium]
MLTRSGWGAIALAAAAFAIGRTFGILELYVLGVGIIAALLVGTATVAGRPPRLVVRRLVDPSTVQAGDAARVDIQIANVGGRKSPVLQLWEPVGSSGGATMNLAPLKPRERSTAAYRLPTTERGIVAVGPMRARRRDVLGLASRTFVLPGRSELLVMPHHTPVRFAPGGSSGRLGDHIRLRAHGQSGSEFHSLRGYVIGDDLRRISWKASARSKDLVVKETALEGVKRCTVVLDTDTSADSPDCFERAVSAAASLVTGAAAAGLVTRLIAPDIDLRGHDVAAQALRWLATVEPSANPEPALPTLVSGDGLGLVLVVSRSGSSRIARIVRGSIGPDETLVVVATSVAPGSARERFMVDASSDESFLESWSQLTGSLGRGAKLPAAYGVAR